MQYKYTLEELENLKVDKFSQINELDIKIKRIIKKLETLSIDIENLRKKYEIEKQNNDIISNDYLQGYSRGTGKYGEALIRPAKIEQHLNYLKTNIYDRYTGKISKINQREYELKKGILEEDLNQAIENVKKIDKEYEESCLKLKIAKAEYDSCAVKIREYNMALAQYNKVKRKLFAEIKKIDAMITKRLNTKTKKKNF